MKPTTIAGIPLQGCVFNASGPLCATKEELDALGASSSAVILTKSCTLEPREGNPEPRYIGYEWGSINSMGLPNLGYEAYVDMMPALKAHDKPVFASVSGLSLEDNLEIITAFNHSVVDAIELNLSCPNIPGKPQVGYDFEQSDDVLGKAVALSEKPLGVKLPPYFDIVHFEHIADLLNKHKVAFVTTINSVGNGLVIDADKEQVVIKPKGGFGGIGGTYVKPTALANVRKLYELLDKDIDIIGVGGVYNGQDVFEYILAGAKAVQLGTVYMEEGTGVFDRIQAEFDAYLAAKGYQDIESFRGTLKVIE